MECCRYLVFKLNDYMKLFKTVPDIHGYLFIFANTETYVIYSETLNNEYIERIHQMSYSSLSDNRML